MSTEQKTSSQSQQTSAQAGESPASYLAQEYIRWQALLQAQPALIQRFFEAQARSLAEALIQPVSQARFALPDRVVVAAGAKAETPVPADQREQLVGGLVDRLTRTGLNVALRQRLDELESAPNEAVAACVGLLRFSTVSALVHDLLPAGRSVRYQAAEGEEIPTIPVAEDQVPGSAITARTDAIAEEAGDNLEEERGELLVPYVPAARQFFLPQWVAFDDEDRLLVNSTAEAEAHLASMQRFVRILHTAVGLAPYIVADERYQQKRSGMLGQLVNQGRALARFETREIIDTIQRRAAASDLNRGLSLRLPYFDDQALEMKLHEFDVIPDGRVMFIPAFVVLAVRKEQVKVGQDTRLNRSTRKHLLDELQMLRISFEHQSN
ncbi:MAG: hypothetical protein JXA78_10360 [Anaerolineales bacterium]|nr:hypothetical protein [Anaerolineales bacterium]